MRGPAIQIQNVGSRGQDEAAVDSMLVGAGFTPETSESFKTFTSAVGREGFSPDTSFQEFVGLSNGPSSQLREKYVAPILVGLERIAEAARYVDAKLAADAKAGEIDIASCVEFMIDINTNRLPEQIAQLMDPFGTGAIKPSAITGESTVTPANTPSVAA